MKDKIKELAEFISIEVGSKDTSAEAIAELIIGLGYRRPPAVEGLVELDEIKLTELIQDINFESYGFSHEEVAERTAKEICQKYGTKQEMSEDKLVEIMERVNADSYYKKCGFPARLRHYARAIMKTFSKTAVVYLDKKEFK